MNDFKCNKFFKNLLLLSALLCAASDSLASTEEIYVIGKQLDEAMSAGDYYNIGRLYAELQRREWEAYKARQSRSSSGSSSPKPSEERELERCRADASVSEASCIRDAKTTYSNNIKTCSVGFTLSVPYFGSIGYQANQYGKCIEEFAATREKHVAICQESKARDMRRCL